MFGKIHTIEQSVKKKYIYIFHQKECAKARRLQRNSTLQLFLRSKSVRLVAFAVEI